MAKSEEQIAEEEEKELRLQVVDSEMKLENCRKEKIAQIQKSFASSLLTVTQNMAICSINHLQLFFFSLVNGPEHASLDNFVSTVLFFSLISIFFTLYRGIWDMHRMKTRVMMELGFENVDIGFLSLRCAMLLRLCDETEGVTDELRGELRELKRRVDRVVDFHTSVKRNDVVDALKGYKRVFVVQMLGIILGLFLLQVAVSMMFWVVWMRSDLVWSLLDFLFKYV